MIPSLARTLDTVDTLKRYDVGSMYKDPFGNVYIYGQGVASCAAGSWVSFDEACQATLLVANAKGRVGIAKAAIVASSYGWFQIAGKNTESKCKNSFSDNAAPYTSSTAGAIDDDITAGDRIEKAFSRSVAVGGVVTVQLDFPFISDLNDQAQPTTTTTTAATTTTTTEATTTT